MKPRVLHVLSQRPLLTGSGITLDALIRHAAEAGWEQRVVVGVPHDEPVSAVGGLADAEIRALTFGHSEAHLDFPVPGMSDVMPYESTRFSAMEAGQLAAYRAAWAAHLLEVIEEFSPDVIHSHHAWILGSLLKNLAGLTPVITHGHGTCLRQMALCPHLADDVREGCRRNERFVVLHDEHAKSYAVACGLRREDVRVVGAGYREDLFFPAAKHNPALARELVYAGKFSRAKGLPWLLDAVERLADEIPALRLHVAGDGSGPEAEELRLRMQTMAPRVILHGRLDQAELAGLMRRCGVFVLPSFYEGLPLVAVEALACGCRVVCTDLPGVQQGLAPILDRLHRVPLPRLAGSDVPLEADLPRFVEDLAGKIRLAVGDAARPGEGREELGNFTWRAVFLRVEAVWREVIEQREKS